MRIDKLTRGFVLFYFLMFVLTISAYAGGNRNYHTHLSGYNQVPNPVATHAQGQAKFKLTKDGQSLLYKLNVANIEDVFMALMSGSEQSQ